MASLFLDKLLVDLFYSEFLKSKDLLNSLLSGRESLAEDIAFLMNELDNFLPDEIFSLLLFNDLF